ncbi:hypothetical protein [Spirosoma luteum]|uniref:hypothetical protein n=1 Tax=Spirosoma luteum TaxID=431553 RepID=UPI00037DF509|nr:hypothetical protein [Spirosoma luteum]
MINTLRISVLLWSTYLVSAGLAYAQDLAPSTATRAVTFQLGVPISTPSSSIEAFMENNGLGGSSSSYAGGVTYPTKKAIPSFGMHVEFFRPRSSFGGALNVMGGSVLGTDDAFVRWRAISLSLLYSYYSRQRTTRISVGPALQWGQTEAGEKSYGFFSTSPPLVGKARIMPGFVIDAAVRFPAHTPFFAELGGHYEVAFGQLHNELTYTNTIRGKRTIPFDLSFNRVSFTVGIGFRLHSR